MAGVERIVNFLRGIDIPSDDIPMDDIPSVDIGSALRRFFSRADIQKRMVEMNQDRLYAEQGNRYYTQLGVYSVNTAKRKKREGEPYHYYTYHDTGATYDSLSVYPEDDSVSISPDPESAPRYALTDLDESAWGLSDPEMDELMPEVRDAVLIAIRNQ